MTGIDQPDAQVRRIGLAAALGAYGFWGLAPLFFKLLADVRADEIIAHRVVWSVIFLFAVLLLRRGRRLWEHMRISPKVFGALAVSGSLVAVNWLIFVFAVNSDRVLSTSLGYFINPLVSVLLGTLVLRERLGRTQTMAVLLAAAGTVYLAVMSGSLPWLSLGLAFSFALYGLVRKITDVGPMVGLFWETLLMAPLAMAWLYHLELEGEMVFRTGSSGRDILLAATGLVTVIPLLLFANAARRLPLTTLGVMQYLAPSITFCMAVFGFNEPFTVNHGIAFGCIWAGLAVFTLGGWQRTRRARIPA